MVNIILSHLFLYIVMAEMIIVIVYESFCTQIKPKQEVVCVVRLETTLCKLKGHYTIC